MTEPLDPPDDVAPPPPIVDTGPDASADEYWMDVGNYGVDALSGK